MQTTWFITGAGRGVGADIARAALQVGDRVVAAGTDVAAVRAALGDDDDRLLTVALDVNDEPQAARAAAAAVARFGTIDVLVNNADDHAGGCFEVASPKHAQAQFGGDLFGVFNVTRTVLPTMRKARRGRIFNIASPAGARGTGFGSHHRPGPSALRGFSESLAKQVAPFGIDVTMVEPGQSGTDFMTRRPLARVAVSDRSVDASPDSGRYFFTSNP